MRWGLGCGALLCAFAPMAVRADLINGDFADFNGWQGTVIDSFTLDATTTDPASGPNFALGGGGTAVLSDSFEFFTASLRQEFTMNAGATELAFDYGWTLTSDTSNPDLGLDFVQAVLIDTVTNTVLNLLDGVDTSASLQPMAHAMVDVSQYSGRAMAIEFLIQDGDFNEADSFRFGNIAVSGAPVTVPEPSSIGLFGVGLVAIWLLRRRKIFE